MSARRALLVLGVLCVVAGLTGLAASVTDGQSLLGQQGARVGAFHHLNPLGGLVVATLGAVALVGTVLRRGLLVLTAAVILLAGALAVPIDQATGAGIIGGSASTMAVLLGLGGGLAACALTREPV